MSSDDGYILTRLSISDEYGLFHYMGESSEPPSHYIKRNATRTWRNPIVAILEAHDLVATSWTEYGLSVNHQVTLDALARWRTIRDSLRP